MTSTTSIDTEQAKTVFSKISAFDFRNVLARYMSVYNASPDAANETLVELKRWLTLCVLHRDNRYATGGKVDDMWHTFILFTKDYAQFCHDIAGSFIHHTPATKSDDMEAQKRSDEKMRQGTVTLEADYLKYFGALPPSHIWPRVRKITTSQHGMLFLTRYGL